MREFSRESAEAILDSSQKIREELATAAVRLDSYIEQLRFALGDADTRARVENGDP